MAKNDTSSDILKGLSNADKRRILRIGAEGIQNLAGREVDQYFKLVDNQVRGIPNFGKSFKFGGVVDFPETGSPRGIGSAMRGIKFKGIF